MITYNKQISQIIKDFKLTVIEGTCEYDSLILLINSSNYKSILPSTDNFKCNIICLDKFGNKVHLTRKLILGQFNWVISNI